MAMKLLEISPSISGDVVECGTWKGGSAVNLSIISKIVGRKLIIYDSFEGLPDYNPLDRESKNYHLGDYCGTLEEVKKNIKKYGCVEVCEFRKGWFNETLPKHKEPIILAFLDVDLEASLDTCIKNMWPNLDKEGYIFSDECVGVHYISLFFSEKWWKENFDTSPPGFIGVGTGLPIGNIYVGPYDDGFADNYPLQRPSTGGYTSKKMIGYWTYYTNNSNDKIGG